MQYLETFILMVGMILICIASVTILVANRQMAVLKQKIGLYIYNHKYQSRHRRFSVIAIILIIIGALDLILLMIMTHFPVITTFVSGKF